MKLNHIFKASCFALVMFGSASFALEPVNNDAASSTSNRSAAQIKHDDAAINQSVKEQIEKSATLSKLNIDVKTKNHVVYLSGNVDSDTQASELIETAQMVIGVKDVDTDHLKVADSKQPMTDMMTTAKIKGLLIREKLFGEKDVAAINTSVETKNGVVYLSGDVDNKQQIENAVAIIKKNVKGVKKVEYKVKKVTSTDTVRQSSN